MSANPPATHSTAAVELKTAAGDWDGAIRQLIAAEPEVLQWH